MAKRPTIVNYGIDPTSGNLFTQGNSNLTEFALARGGPLSLGFVPHALAKDPDDSRTGVVDGEYVVFTTNGATDVMVPHTLRRTPRRFVLVNGPAGVNVQVFRGPTAWTDSRVYFRSNTTGDKVTVEIA
jgi:hypothetical protein